MAYLIHPDDSLSQRLETEHGAVLVSLATLQQDVQLVTVPLEEVWVLEAERQLQRGVEEAAAWKIEFIGAQGPLARLHLDGYGDRGRFRTQGAQYR